MFNDLLVNKLYVINGLSRSGNHLFISWLISGINDNNIVYFNNIKPTRLGFIEHEERGKEPLHKQLIINKYVITKDNVRKCKFDDFITKKLATTKMCKLLLDNKLKKVNTMIISIENKTSLIYDKIISIFPNCKQTYPIMIIRDYLNLIASRLESEKKLTSPLPADSIYYFTDNETIKWWIENYEYTKQKNTITFNYNKFICYNKEKKSLAKKLDIDYKKAKVTENKFGLLGFGTSFPNMDKTLKNYFSRYLIFINHPLISAALKNQELLNIIKNDFCLEIINDKINKICGKDVNKL